MPAIHPSAFVPTPPQRRLLAFVDAHPGFKTIQEMCDGAQVPRTTYYRWCADPQFRIWFSTAWSARLMMDGVVLLNQARLLATRSFSYWKALFTLISDPKGLALLQQWQQNCAQAPADAFLGDPDPTPEPEPAPPPAPPRPPQREYIHPLLPSAAAKTVPPSSQRNQSLGSQNETKSRATWMECTPKLRHKNMRRTNPPGCPRAADSR